MLEVAIPAIVGLCTAVVGVVSGWVARPRVDKRNGNGKLYIAAQNAVDLVRRDMEDVNREMCSFHARLETAITAQATATTAMILALNTQTGVLTGIKEALVRMENKIPNV